MRVIALGRLDDIRGFALAGVETARCESARDGIERVNALATDASVGIIVLPAWLGDRAASVVTRLRAHRGGPVVVVLPETGPDRSAA